MPSVDIVIPTSGRRSLGRLLRALAAGPASVAGQVIVVDDRASREGPLPLDGAPAHMRVVDGRAAGPAAARNAGWRAALAEWIAFLDDDVVPSHNWGDGLAADLAGLGRRAAASQGRIRVPLPRGRRPTDWERNVAGLERARWATADMAYRGAALEHVGGFDERFPRAYREDADLGLRLQDAGWSIERGRRVTSHPVGESGFWKSVRLQAGNADDPIMRAVHGPRWRARAGAPPGRRPRHVVTTAAGVLSLAAVTARLPRVAAAAAASWGAGTSELAWARIAPGPKTPRELAKMLATSALIPPAATGHWILGLLRARSLARATRRPRTAAPPQAVLLDRDGTLIHDVPYNGDPALVLPMPGAAEALARLREAGVKLAVVSNQSGVGRGLISGDQVAAVNRRVEEMLGAVGPWVVCDHAPDDGCDCRKPAPGLVLRAAELLGVEPERCALIGDVGADMQAAHAAGARGVLVPTGVTRADEIASAPESAPDLGRAVDLLLGGAA